MISAHMIHIKRDKKGHNIQDSQGHQGVGAQELSTSPRGQEGLHRVLILILVRYSKCSSLEEVAARCLPMNLQTIHMRMAILLPKCLEGKEEAG